MSSFNFKVGMSIDNVRDLANKTNVPKEIKNLIFDFCDKDLDKKVTDDIEIHILNTWFSGQKQIKMPNQKRDNLLTEIGKSLVSYLGVDYVSKDSYDKMGTHVERVRTWEYGIGGNFNPGNISESYLYDHNNDGFADVYCTGTAYNKFPNTERRNIGI